MKIESVFKKDAYTSEGWRQMEKDAEFIAKLSELLSAEEFTHLAEMLDARFPESFRLISEVVEGM